MKKLVVLLLNLVFAGFLFAQELPDDVEKVYKSAERFKSKKELNQAVDAYKEVLRSVNHVPSMVSIGEIEMDLRQPPNYRMAYEYYDQAIKTLESGMASATKKSVKKYLTEQRDELIPKRNKAKSYVDDFDKAKELKQDGNRLMEEE
jgi:tetratricopeptide (TPR) repeat protein